MKTLVVWLTLIMFFAKIFGVVTFSWFTVFLPVAIYLGFIVLLLMLGFMVAILGAILGN